MTTFSQLVDSMTAETLRPDMTTQIVSFLNQTIRECHFDPTHQAPVNFPDNYNEDQLTADVEEGFYWTIPDATVFQGVQAVRFDSGLNEYGERRYAEQVIPGRLMESKLYSYQRAGSYVYFKGYGGLDALISIAWFQYLGSLKYYTEATRPASYDIVDGWTYHVDYDDTDENRAIARGLVSNWMLLRWRPVLEEGLRAKIYKRLSDAVRAGTSYSLYTQQRQGLIFGEIADYGGVSYAG